MQYVKIGEIDTDDITNKFEKKIKQEHMFSSCKLN